MRYVAILRGINISGQKKIRMADLRAQLGELGYDDLQTYIQSGNVIFSSPKRSTSKLAAEIRAKIDEHYGFDVPVIVLTRADLRAVHTGNPFADRDLDPRRFYVVFLAERPSKAAAAEVATLGGDAGEELVLDGRAIYLHCPGGYGKSKLNNNLFERRLRMVATTRNWNTVTKLVELVG